MTANDMNLRLSVITPCLNRVDNVECCIQSVLRQGYPNVEHIVVDGGSTDGTLEVLARYPHLKLLTGKDAGMYDALNRGLEIASGEVIGFLNTDDLYADHVFPVVMEWFADEKMQIVSGKAQIFREEADGTRKTVAELSPPASDKLVEVAITGSTIFNAWFYRKTLIRQAGGFDPQYKISGDADLVLRLALMGAHYVPLGSLHYLYRQHEGSLTFQMDSEKLLRVFQDHSLFIKKHLASAKLPDKDRSLLNVLYANTCSSVSHQYLSEKKMVQSFLWKIRAWLGRKLPISKLIVLMDN